MYLETGASWLLFWKMSYLLRLWGGPLPPPYCSLLVPLDYHPGLSAESLHDDNTRLTCAHAILLNSLQLV